MNVSVRFDDGRCIPASGETLNLQRRGPDYRWRRQREARQPTCTRSGRWHRRILGKFGRARWSLTNLPGAITRP